MREARTHSYGGSYQECGGITRAVDSYISSQRSTMDKRKAGFAEDLVGFVGGCIGTNPLARQRKKVTIKLKQSLAAS